MANVIVYFSHKDDANNRLSNTCRHSFSFQLRWENTTEANSMATINYKKKNKTKPVKANSAE